MKITKSRMKNMLDGIIANKTLQKIRSVNLNTYLQTLPKTKNRRTYGARVSWGTTPRNFIYV